MYRQARARWGIARLSGGQQQRVGIVRQRLDPVSYRQEV
jgi:ABC-type proline/glycine betaine transport system ATPase subunit